MKILMFGWELPPFNSGGLGVACLGLAQALVNQGIDLTFVLPQYAGVDPKNLKLLFASRSSQIKAEDFLLMPYITSKKYSTVRGRLKANLYSQTLFGEVARYAKRAREIAAGDNFDVIHAHDWLSFGAGLAAKKAIRKPLVVHVHATEFDRGGGNVDSDVYLLEKEGMELSDKVIAVSNFTKNIIIDHYQIPPEKIEVVHNEINPDEYQGTRFMNSELKHADKIVLFVGRITLQKGLDYFLKAAQIVLQFRPNTLFVVAGSGDMEHQMIELAASLGISNRVIFAGFLRGKELQQVYQQADLFVLPSVSEPFGITPLESLINGTPVILSKQSGVSEVIKNSLVVDFWDTSEMANQILCVLNYASLHKCLTDYGQSEALKFNWMRAASKVKGVYQGLSA